MSTPPPLSVATLIDMIPATGGAEVLAAGLVERLDRTRIRPSLITYRYLMPGDERRSQDEVLDRLRAAGVDVLELDGVNRFDVACWRPLLRRMMAGQIDVLHSHKHGPNLWASLLSRLAPVPVVVAHEHTWSFVGERRRQLSDRWVVATRADAYLAVSEADRRAMIDIEDIPAELVEVLPNGIPSVPRPEGATLRDELGVPEGAPLVGAIASLREQKDFPTLLRAHAQLLEQRPDAHLVIIGDGPDRPRIEAVLAGLDVGDRVHLAGYRRDAGRAAWELDVAVNSSTFEGSSLAILEYMAAGRPIVATDVGGSRELLDDGRVGVLVPPGDPTALATAIGRLLDDPAAAAALGRAAAERQQEQYDIDRQVERLEELYLRLHGAATARAAQPTPG